MSRILAAFLLAPLLGACTSSIPADPLSARHPADPAAGLRSTGHPSTIGDYQHREPTGPGSWRDLNDRQAPDRERGS